MSDVTAVKRSRSRCAFQQPSGLLPRSASCLVRRRHHAAILLPSGCDQKVLPRRPLANIPAHTQTQLVIFSTDRKNPNAIDRQQPEAPTTQRALQSTGAPGFERDEAAQRYQRWGGEEALSSFLGATKALIKCIKAGKQCSVLEDPQERLCAISAGQP